MAEVTGLRNNALPYPCYAIPWGVVFPILDADGDPVTGATGLDSEVSLNGDAFADCTNEATEIGSTGMYYLLLTSAEMQADVVTVIVKTSTVGAKTTPMVFYPRRLVQATSGTSQGGASGSITLAVGASALDDFYTGMVAWALIDSAVEARTITSYTGSTKVAGVSPNWNVTPDADDTYVIYIPDGVKMPSVNVTAFGGVAGTFASGLPSVDATKISGDSVAADNLETAYDDTAGAVRWMNIVDQGTAQSAGATTLVLRSAAAFADDELIGARILITGGSAGVGQSRLITDYVGATDTATVSAWQTTPSGTITYKIISDTAASGGSAPTAAEVADAVWDEATSGHTTSGTFGEQLKTDVDAILVDTTTLVSRITSALFSGITSMAQWLGLIAGKQTGNSTARTEVRATGAGSGTFDETTDSQEAIRDRGDAAWTTATGFSTHSAADVWAVGTRRLTDGTNIVLAKGTGVTGFNDPTAAAIADAVWEEAIADHSGTAGSTAEALSDAGGAGTPPTVGEIADAVWDEATAGHTTGGTFGAQAKTVLDARATQTSVDDLPTNAELATALGTADDAVLAAIAALNNLSQANIRTAVGLGSANLDTQLDALPTNAELATALGTADDAVLAAIAALNNLSQANIRTAVGLASANLDTQLDALPTNAELATALASADDSVLAAIAALNNLSSAQVTAAVPTATQNADALLKRDFSAVTGEATRSALNALRFLRNKWSIAAGTLTVKKEDDSTNAWTGAVTQTAGDPVSEIDPA